MAMKLGELLVQRGLLTERQVDEIIRAQKDNGRPFGELAESMFGLTAEEIESAWAAQFTQLTETFDPTVEPIDTDVLELVDRRRAWQFGVLPIRRENDGLLMATTQDYLARAARFVAWHIREPVYFVVAQSPQLEQALRERYPLPGARLTLFADRSAIADSWIQRQSLAS
jgi:type IV pilus assembly protein PilB